MTGFAASIQQFALKVEQRTNAVFVSTAVELQKSIKYGSALTGAPPMPVAIAKYFRAGALRDSIMLTFPDANTALIYTTKWYAPNVNSNSENHTFSSGGPHGWDLTQAAFPRVVEAVANRVAKNG